MNSLAAASLDDVPQRTGIYARVKDLMRPDWAFYWTDLGLSGTLGWGALLGIIVLGPGFWSLALYPVAVLALYRAILFIHEITHQQGPQGLRFRLGWNLFIGHPFMMPSIMYEGIHILHHGPSSYGTARDPEYMPLAGNGPKVALILAALPLHTALILIRFTLLTPLVWLIPPFRRLIEGRLSALTFNLDYVRTLTSKERLALRKAEAGILLSAGIMAWLALLAGVFWWALLSYYAVLTGVNVINGFRTMGGTHLYANASGEKMARDVQLADSLDAAEGVLPLIWAPVGLRYHATHHLVPNAPYHNLKAIRQRLLESEDGSLLAQSTTEGLGDGMGRLLRARPR